MHRLVYRITLNSRKTRPVNINPPSPKKAISTCGSVLHTQFQWHRQSRICTAHSYSNQHNDSDNDGLEPCKPLISNEVRFIEEAGCESTLKAIQQAIRDGVEFCVHAKSLQPSDAHNASKKPIENFDARDSAKAVNTEMQCYLQCMTAGSNGEPKRIRRTQLSWINSFVVNAKNANLSTNDSYAIVGSLSHSLTLYAALEAAWVGANIHALSDLRPDKQFKAIATLASSVLYATPTQLRMLCSHFEQPIQTNTSLKHIFCGGGKLDHATRAQLTGIFPNASIQEFYGASETSFITISNKTTPIDSVGKLYKNVQLQIRPIDTQTHEYQPMPTGSMGEIWIKSPYLFETYATGAESYTRWRDGFLCIGEMGYQDDEGHLYLTGRRSRMVNVADNIVFPEQIEKFLNAQDAVRQSAVIPTRDSKRGTVLIAIVEAHDDLQLCSQLLQITRQHFGALKAPKQFYIVEHLPQLSSGKPDLGAIAQQYTST